MGGLRIPGPQMRGTLRQAQGRHRGTLVWVEKVTGSGGTRQESVLQGLKPAPYQHLFGMTEVMPFLFSCLNR